MRTRKVSLMALLLVLTMGVLVPSAGAYVTTLNLQASSYANGNLAYYFNGNTSGYVGQINATVTSGALFPGNNTFAPMYCVLLGSDIYPGNNLFNVSPTNTIWTVGNGMDFQGKWAAYLYNTFAPTVNSATKGAALQIALWEVVYDGQSGYGYDLNAGQFRFSSNAAILSQATSYLNTQGLSVAGYYDDTQDLIGPVVPEPGSLLLLGMGLFGAGTLAWRTRKRG